MAENVVMWCSRTRFGARAWCKIKKRKWSIKRFMQQWGRQAVDLLWVRGQPRALTCIVNQREFCVCAAAVTQTQTQAQTQTERRQWLVRNARDVGVLTSGGQPLLNWRTPQWKRSLCVCVSSKDEGEFGAERARVLSPRFLSVVSRRN